MVIKPNPSFPLPLPLPPIRSPGEVGTHPTHINFCLYDLQHCFNNQKEACSDHDGVDGHSKTGNTPDASRLDTMLR